eukprot:CAMPEP_0174281524 /NCGR_PEP_ID=MMETSP0809-20121228/1906_1 /TAXON_ID=73025 ORGANISM="Eutreptiella gymnastica-like, Strain CCMP1594" /NCGR_SAMPLE_ID=MMETSP0809 /ASSEMBLY_ACC=CAM_ASM_000658 /LENGTH=58 /DNA_ID=CAMNT_0015375125 /DNA_START=1607 /DNA_END=1783 /DNA_ORIENTATION=-
MASLRRLSGLLQGLTGERDFMGKALGESVDGQELTLGRPRLLSTGLWRLISGALFGVL